jgi:ribonucleoside-diphosphate reductase alpha chain
MQRVQEDSLWTLFDPNQVRDLTELYGKDFEKRYVEHENDPNIRKETISAKNLWKIILRSYFETGSPFLTFKDEANRRNQNKHSGIVRSSNLCTEIFQNTDYSKEVIRVWLGDGEEYLDNTNPEVKIQTDEGNYKTPYKLNSTDTINGKTVYAVEKIQVGGKTAVCNLMSVNLSKVNTKEKIEEVVPVAIRMLDNIIDLNFYPTKRVKDTNLANRAIGLGIMGEAQYLAEHKILFGTKEHLNAIDEIMEMISYNAIESSVRLAEEKGTYPEFEDSEWSRGVLPIDTANAEASRLVEDRERVYDWNKLRVDVMNKGLRNGYLMAIAPTSSISILVGTTQAIEPVYKRKWFEENLTGLIPVTAPNISPDTLSYYITAYEVKQADIIKAAAVRQRWLDQGQSTNIFVNPNEVKGSDLNKIYMLAWKLGLKSTYYLRSQSPEVMDRSTECTTCQ